MRTYLVRRIVPGEWRHLRAITLESLRDTPVGLGESYPEVAARAEDTWRAKASAGATADNCAIFVAGDQDGAWAGTASVAPLLDVPDHAHLHAVYVCPAHRGPTGPAARLVATAIRFAREHIDVSHLTLGVHEHNARALAFYRRIGFEMTGKVIPYVRNPAEKCYIMAYPAFRRDHAAARPA